MACLVDRSDSEHLYGETPDEIAERIWGRGAYVRREAQVGDDCYIGTVRRNIRGRIGAVEVLASVAIYPYAEEN